MTNHLSHIYWINLEFATERRDNFLSYMANIEGAEPLLERFDAHDGSKYENRDVMVQDALDKGFYEMENMSHRWTRWMLKGTVGYLWSYVSCLRKIVERDEYGLILFDDRPLNKSVAQVNGLLDVLGDVNILQLEWWNDFGCVDTSPIPVIASAPGTSICDGIFSPGDSHNVYSPEGAQWLLDLFRRSPQFIENLIWVFRDYLPSGTYHIKDRDAGWGTHIDYDEQDRLLINSVEENQ